MKSASTTEVRKTLRPGQPGTLRIQRDWGGRLVCVRHRVDTKRGVRFTTAEIVISTERTAKTHRIHPEALVYARVAEGETGLRKRLMEANAATYDTYLGVWRMQYATAIRLGLGRRILLHRPKPTFRVTPSLRKARPARQNWNIPAHRLLAIPAHRDQNPPEAE